MKKYKTIVVDPPWPMKFGSDRKYMERPSYIKNASKSRGRENWNANFNYQTMTLQEIEDLRVNLLGAIDSHLYLWVTNKYIPDAYRIVKKWGYIPSCLLSWVKTPAGLGLGGTFVQTSEHILFARKGRNVAKKRINTTWWNWKRPQSGTVHSKKPESFQDMVETVSPEPRVELFARRKRDGWDVWGNEVESDIVLIT